MPSITHLYMYFNLIVNLKEFYLTKYSVYMFLICLNIFEFIKFKVE